MSAMNMGGHQNGHMVVVKKTPLLEGCCICMLLYVTGLVQHQTVKKYVAYFDILGPSIISSDVDIQTFCIIPAKSQ